VTRPYYEQDGITIYHGDARDILPSLSKVPLVLTDPPYAARGSRGEWGVTASVAIALDAAARLVSKGGAMLTFSTTSGRGLEFTTSAVGRHLSLNRLLTWHRPIKTSRVAGPWRWDAVAILAFGRATFGNADRSSVFVGESPTPLNGGHPSPLPDALAEWLYEPFDAPDVTVLDPFMGTGTLLVPGAQRGRRVIGIEINEAYCETAAKRLQQAATPMEVSA
jgi:DNA modification methylase